MSHLKLFRPNEPAGASVSVADGGPAVIFAFTSEQGHKADPTASAVVERAQTIHSNRRCPHCQGTSVSPLELADALLNQNHKPIPGTATLVGFRCHLCLVDWPA